MINFGKDNCHKVLWQVVKLYFQEEIRLDQWNNNFRKLPLETMLMLAHCHGRFSVKKNHYLMAKGTVFSVKWRNEVKK